MLTDITELTGLREEAIRQHQSWKRRSLTLDAIAADQWQTIWDDLTAEIGEPLVENTVLQMLEDKTAEAASVAPKIFVWPTRGTRSDRAERVAAQRRRVFKSYEDRSMMEVNRVQLFLDWFGHAAAYLTPHCDAYYADGNVRPPAARFPYMVRVDPRQVYPLSHNNTGRLTSVIFTRLRKLTDVKNEYGATHPGILNLEYRHRLSHGKEDGMRQVEETWYYDETTIAVSLSLRPIRPQYDTWRYVAPVAAPKTSIDEWLVEPMPHGLDWCPVAEAKRKTNDGEYRAPVDSVIPRLKVAQNIMARYLEDMSDSIFGPVVFQNIENEEDYGPNAHLRGDGQGDPNVIYPRKPMNFEAIQAVKDQLEMARRQGKFPESRSGSRSGGWTTGRGQDKLEGGYDAELRLAHIDIAHLISWGNVLTAQYDEVHCAGRKTIEGHEGKAAWIETYDPAVLFKGDYRNVVTYGSAAGLDVHNLLSMLALSRSMNAISQRTFMTEAGLVDDPLQEERDMLLENAVQGGIQFFLQQAAAGNLAPLQMLAEKVDGDTMTARQAVMEVIRETQAPVPTEGPTAGGGNEIDPLRQVASLEAGGAGTEGGLSRLGGRLRQLMPANRALNQ
jgi:hypothetical protein